ncbi:uncharacterized protein MYCFIDRAFT_176152 [Pseudocercospora fijiensis CIRAD86]|uniref:non-specific serine/threonine protein kinase n=1 Tax=Pseudocercospora fijiensis (strain CIRAD86) TaxID=383855 RepID=M3AUH4_PSEFD|nr:uncharacterized protein MYCFIDRAFT_176152 [Pseudocercospora fijiensis CIRAD86]EME80773.1 hypothetical protein MYCFIDRAFT_176152 [Pseudocercospora fijiensis CIRAD86]
MSDQAFEDWKSLRAYAYDLSEETTSRSTYEAIPIATRKKLGPLISKYLESLKDVPIIEGVINETAGYYLDEISGAEELDNTEPGVGIDGKRKVQLETLREHIAAGNALLNTTRTEDQSVSRVLGRLVRRIDPKIQEFVKATNEEWTQLRQPWEGENGKLAKLQQLLQSCEDSASRQARLREEYRMGKSWVGGWSFAKKGAIGNLPLLWIKQGMDQSILDVHSYLTSIQWSKKLNHFWYDPLDPDDEEKTVPSEIAAMAALRGRKGSTNIVNLRNWHMFEDRLMYRLYLEFCPHGDLGQWTCWYKELRDADLAKRNYFPEPVKPDENTTTKSAYKKALGVYVKELADYTEKMKSKDPVKIAAEFHKTRDELERIFLPEPQMLISSRAGQEMEQPAPDDKWETILHLDYKPRNIFLGLPDDEQYKGYPVPKTGDYGLAKIVPRDDNRSTNDYPVCGTPFCKPREQTKVPYPGEERMPRRRMDAKTNVWGMWFPMTDVRAGVGIIMWSLLELEDGDHRLSYDPLETSEGVKNDGDENTLDRPTFRKPAENHYSSNLRDLILICLSHEQRFRPPFSKLLEYIQKRTDESKKIDHANGLRRAREDDPKWQDERNVLPSLREDMFKGYLTGLSKFPDDMDEFPAPPSTQDDRDDVPGSSLGVDRIVQRRLKRKHDQQGQAQVGAGSSSSKGKQRGSEAGGKSPKQSRPDSRTPSKSPKRKRGGGEESVPKKKSPKRISNDMAQEDIDGGRFSGRRSKHTLARQ